MKKITPRLLSGVLIFCACASSAFAMIDKNDDETFVKGFYGAFYKFRSDDATDCAYRCDARMAAAVVNSLSRCTEAPRITAALSAIKRALEAISDSDMSPSSVREVCYNTDKATLRLYEKNLFPPQKKHTITPLSYMLSRFTNLKLHEAYPPDDKAGKFYRLLASLDFLPTKLKTEANAAPRNFTGDFGTLAYTCDARMILAAVNELAEINSVRFWPTMSGHLGMITAKESPSSDDRNVEVLQSVAHTGRILESVKLALQAIGDEASSSEIRTKINSAKRELAAGNLFSNFSDLDMHMSLAPLNYILRRLFDLQPYAEYAQNDRIAKFYRRLISPEFLAPDVRDALKNFSEASEN
ncbi:MAG: hypothetical protein LBO73_01850 [Holosporaceae bacterium]|jgi:hypothetical protein|nr:hypothetical protein [Holosporaceae bacterium]